MGRKILIFSLLCFMALSFSKAFANDTAQDTSKKGKSITLVDTADMRYQKTPLRKLQRGVVNFLTCPLEVPASILNVSMDEQNVFTGYTLGGVQGLFTSLLRGLEGIFDVVTFIVPPYSKSIMTPEFAWDSLAQAFARHEEQI